jgi:hypothetical protein
MNSSSSRNTQKRSIGWRRIGKELGFVWTMTARFSHIRLFISIGIVQRFDFGYVWNYTFRMLPIQCKNHIIITREIIHIWIIRTWPNGSRCKDFDRLDKSQPNRLLRITFIGLFDTLFFRDCLTHILHVKVIKVEYRSPPFCKWFDLCCVTKRDQGMDFHFRRRFHVPHYQHSTSTNVNDLTSQVLLLQLWRTLWCISLVM